MKINICNCTYDNRPLPMKRIYEVNIHKLEITISFEDNTFAIYARKELK